MTDKDEDTLEAADRILKQTDHYDDEALVYFFEDDSPFVSPAETNPEIINQYAARISQDAKKPLEVLGAMKQKKWTNKELLDAGVLRKEVVENQAVNAPLSREIYCANCETNIPLSQFLQHQCEHKEQTT